MNMTLAILVRVLVLVWAGMATTPADALPSFARQTGFECTVCHLSWPELTSVGRQFKLGGYTLIKPVVSASRPWVSFDRDGDPPVIPLAAFVQVSLTSASRPQIASPGAERLPQQNRLLLQQLSLFLAGRLQEHAGAFVQWTYDGVAHHSAIDNAELRVANRLREGAWDVSYGLSLNNSPSMSDLYNTTPVWSFPFASSAVAPTPAAAPLVQAGLAQQVVGLVPYALWNRTLYVELGGYRTASGALSIFRTGVDRSQAAVLDGVAPYWRLALQHEWDKGTQSAMVGTFGLTARKFPDPLAAVGQADRFTDTGVDAQYQYITDAHRFSGQFAYVRERQQLDGTFAAGGSANPTDGLQSLNAKLSYYYLARYGVSVAVQGLRGSPDHGLYDTGAAIDGSINGSPNSTAAIVELNWLPLRNLRFSAQYTDYLRFNGSRTDYDGHGRNARDNNTLFLSGWFPL